MNHFELVCIFKPDLTNQSIDNLTKKVLEIIENLEGKIIGKEIWGLRNFSYTIKTYKKGFYIFLQLDINGNIINKINNAFNINEDIIRYLIIKVDKHEKLPTIILKEKENNNEK